MTGRAALVCAALAVAASSCGAPHVDDGGARPGPKSARQLHPVHHDGKYGYIDSTGSLVIPAQFDYAGRFSGKVAHVMVGKEWVYINTSGDCVPKPEQQDAAHHPSHSTEGLTRTKVGKKYGFIGAEGEMVIEPRFANVDHFCDGLAIAQEPGGAFGFIDKTGRFVIEPQFGLYPQSFSGGLAQVVVGGKGSRNRGSCYVDKTGQFVWPITGRRHEAVLMRGAAERATKHEFMQTNWGLRHTSQAGRSSMSLSPVPWSTDWGLRLRVLDPAKAPLAGVQVWVEDQTPGCWLSGGSTVSWWDVSAHGRGTDRDDWIETSVPSGIVSDAEGIVELGPFRGPVRYSASGQCRLYHPDFASHPLHLDLEGSARDDEGFVDVGDVVLMPGNTITGVVRGPDGSPMPGAWVAAQPSAGYEDGSIERGGDGREEVDKYLGLFVGWLRTARTDADGRYAIRGLCPLQYVVAAWTDAFPPSHLPIEFGVGAGMDSAEGEVERADLTLEAGETITVLAREGEHPGMPMVGAQVEVKLEYWDGGDNIGLGNTGDLRVFEGRTDEGGKLIIRSLPRNAEYVVWVTGSKGARWCSGVTKPGAVEVASFRYGGLRVKIESDSGKPVRRFRCWLTCIDSGKEDRSSWARGITADDNHYEFVESDSLSIPALVCGKWKITLDALGHSRTSETFDITPAGHELILRLESSRGVLRGRVIDADTRSPMARVEVHASYDSQWRPKYALQVKYVTDEQGRFYFENMRGPGSTAYLKIEYPDRMVVHRHWAVDEMVHDVGDIILERACILRGTLTRGGRPVPNEFVQLWSTENKIRCFGSVETDPAGTWQREQLTPGRYLVVYCGARKYVDVAPGAATDAGPLEINDIWEP